MECPNCHKSGNFLKKIFSKHDKDRVRTCLNCGFKIRFTYVWKKIAILCVFVFLFLIVINGLMQYFGYPGLTGTMAGGMGGVLIAIAMQRSPFLKIEHLSKIKNDKKTK